jgi:autotransporter-associated beta strand protein
VVALPVTVSGASAKNKVFDGTTTATVTGGTVVTPVAGDTATEININGGTFANAGPGTGIGVTVVLGGTKASSYSLSAPPALTANIFAAAIWTNILGGTWSTAGNWANNAVGTGVNVTADFNSVNLTADTTVTNDTALTIGNLIFGDTDTSSAGSWTVVSNTITLAAPAPTITVNPLGAGATATINSILTGANGLTKNGTGTLTLGGLNSYTGGLTVNNGTLIFPASLANTFTGGVTNNGGSLVISNMNSVGCAGGSSSSSNSINLNGGTFSYGGGTLASETLTFALLGGTSTIDLSSDSSTLRGGAAVVGPGNLVKTGLGTLCFGRNSSGTLGNTFTGNILVTGGQMDIRNPDSLGDVAGSTTVSNATLYIDPFGQAWGVTFNAEPLEFFGNSYIRNYDQSATVAQVNTLTGPMTNSGTLSIFSQTSGAYAELDINGDLTNTAGSSLVLGGVAIGNNGTTGPSTNGQIITINGVVSGPASVSAVGDSTSVYNLANNNYSGNTTVSGGTLRLALATLATNSTVTVTTNAVLQLDFTGITNTIGTLVLNGVTQPVGVYDSINGAPYITGSGSLQVVYSAPPLSTNAHLTSLAITPAGTLSPAFASNVTTYAATNAYVASPTVTVVNADLTATNRLIFNGATNLLASGVASSPLSLTLGVNNPVVVQVTAQDGITVKTYTVNVTRQPSQASATLSNSVSGSTLTLSWPADHLGYSLQAQTNSLSSGLGTNWVTLPGSASVTTTNLPINNVNPTVFYRLVYP